MKVPTLMPPFLLCDLNADKVHSHHHLVKQSGDAIQTVYLHKNFDISNSGEFGTNFIKAWRRQDKFTSIVISVGFPLPWISLLSYCPL